MTKFTKGQKVRIMSDQPSFIEGKLATVQGPAADPSLFNWEVDVLIDGDEGLGKLSFYDDELELAQ